MPAGWTKNISIQIVHEGRLQKSLPTFLVGARDKVGRDFCNRPSTASELNIYPLIMRRAVDAV